MSFIYFLGRLPARLGALGAALLGLMLATSTTWAQAPPAAPVPDAKVVDGKVYTYVEQMPELPGGGGSAAIVTAIQRELKYPAAAIQQGIAGRVFVSFTVGEDGRVRGANIVKGIGGGCDEAVLAAVARLPVFTPGRQVGHPVPVSFTVPVTFRMQAPAPLPDSLLARRVYTYVEHMPELPGGGGVPAIVQAIRQRLVLPAAAGKGSARDVVHVAFSVSTAGTVRDARVVKGVNPGLDAAVLAAVNQLPAFTPGSQNGRPVVVSYTVPVPAKPLH